MDKDISHRLCEQVREARSEGRLLRIRGTASKPWMKAVPGQQELSLAEHRGVVAYDPTELVITVRAGTRLAELDQVLSGRGQMLGAECPDFDGASTIGGALATGWSGSRQPWAGALRDAVLGARIINGLAEDLQFGGRVMKNVAGFDISRLLSGSLGRLGVILELSLKVLPLPEAETTLVFEYESLQQSRQFVRSLQQRGEPLSAAAYQAGRLILRFSGQRQTLSRLAGELDGAATGNDFWHGLRRLQLPLFDPGNDGVKDPAPLYDWNGGLCWSCTAAGAVTRQVGDNPAVDLEIGPLPPGAGAGNDPLALLQQRLAQAFDPDGVFQPVRAAAA